MRKQDSFTIYYITIKKLLSQSRTKLGEQKSYTRLIHRQNNFFIFFLYYKNIKRVQGKHGLKILILWHKFPSCAHFNFKISLSLNHHMYSNINLDLRWVNNWMARRRWFLVCHGGILGVRRQYKYSYKKLVNCFIIDLKIQV